jgi:hypothetical protein
MSERRPPNCVHCAKPVDVSLTGVIVKCDTCRRPVHSAYETSCYAEHAFNEHGGSGGEAIRK